MIIDIHAHMLPTEIEKTLPHEYASLSPQVRDVEGQPYLFVENKRSIACSYRMYDLQQRIRDMESQEVEVQLLSVFPQTLCYSLDTDAAVAICRAQNDAIAEVARSHRSRFFGVATVPLQNPKLAALELERAMRLGGIVAVQIGSNIAGLDLSDRTLDIFYSAASKLDAPILIHPMNVVGGERLSKYYLRNLIGNPSETSIAFAFLLFGGVFERFPDLRFCFAHGGGFVPYQKGRLLRGFNVVPETRRSISKFPDEYLRNVYFDTILHFEPALRYLVEVMGAPHVLMGSDYPFEMGDPSPVQFVHSSRLSDCEKRLILSQNAMDVFKIK